MLRPSWPHALAATRGSAPWHTGRVDASRPFLRSGGRRQCAATMPDPRPPRQSHHVYVVLLDDRVWNEPSFRKANPDHALGGPASTSA